MKAMFLSCGVTVVALGLLAPLAVSDDPPPPADESARKSRYFDDPQIFAEMSGAKRAALERKFGARPVRGVAFTGEEFTDERARASTAPLVRFPNVLVNDPASDTTAQDTQSETALIFGSGSNVVAAFNDSGSHAGGASRFTGWALSTNGGASFTDKGTLPDNPDGDSGDPVFARSNNTGTIFLSTLSFNTGHKLLIFRSTNNGASFNVPVNGAPGFTPATGEQDKQWIAADNSPGAGFGNVYMFWRNFAASGGMTFSRSTDDGVTWGPSGGLKLADGGQGAHVTVGKDHAVYVFWHDSSVTPREIRMRKSTNQGVSFGPPVTVAKLKATGINGDLGLSPAFRTNSFPQAVANPANANLLFAVYNDQTGSGGTLDRADIYLTRSANGGVTWSAPIKVNDDATRRDQWQPSLAISPNGKKLCVAWYDRRLDPANNLIDRFRAIGSVTVFGTVAFGPNVRVTNQSFPPVVGVDPLVNSLYMGDYDQMAATATHFGTTWGDNRDNSTGHAGKNANVRFAKFLVSGAAEPTSDGGGTNEPSVAISPDDVPEFAHEAIKQAVEQAPADVLAKPVTWEQAFELQDTIAMYMLRGTDAKGRSVEVESKGTRVVELEVKVSADALPEAVRNGMRTMAAAFAPTHAEAVIVAGKVVAYTLVGSEDGANVADAPASPAGPAGGTSVRKTEASFSPDGKLVGRRNIVH